MGQTIICEFLAEWDETEKQPNPIDHGFDGLYSMLEECQNVMFALGESVNEKAALAARVDVLCMERGERIAELEGTIDFLNSAKIVQKARITELEQKNAWLQAQLDAANKAFGHTMVDETVWCEVCNLPAEHCRENHAIR